MTNVPSPARTPWGTGRALLAGTLAVGVLDALDAIVFFGLYRNVKPHRIFQAIASGLLGRASFEGGARTVLLGVVLHFFIAFSIVGVYALAARKVDALWRHAWASGIAYGVLVWLFMNFVVLPLTPVKQAGFSPPVVLNGVLIHMFGVGLPAALAARRRFAPFPTR